MLKALKEAFDVVGSPPTPEESFSFVEAGNPVMALVRQGTHRVAALLVYYFSEDVGN